MNTKGKKHESWDPAFSTKHARMYYKVASIYHPLGNGIKQTEKIVFLFLNSYHRMTAALAHS
jgi:hypothetical protein